MTVKLSKNGKKLGRPPKSSVIPETFIIQNVSKNIETPKIYISNDEMLECSFIPINEYSHIQGEFKRFGRYAQSTYPVSKFGKNSFVVLAYIDVDLKKYRDDGNTDEQIVAKCVNYLNQEEKKKKGSVKPYGNLQLYGYRMIQKFGKEIIAIELVTDHRTNENFWGTGIR